MESYLRAGQRWLSESDVAAKLDFCSLLGIHVKAPPKEGGGKLLEGVLIPFAFLKPLFDRLEDSEVTQRLAHLQPAVIGKDLNQRRELAIIYRKIVEWCRGPHFTPEHLATLGRYLGIPASASKEQILTGFLYSFIFSASSPHLGYTSHITLNAGDIVPLSLTPHAAAASTTATTASSARSPSPPPSFGSSVHTATSTKRADSPNSVPLVRVKQEPRDEDLDTDGGLARLASGVEVKRERQPEGHMFDQLSSHFETDAQDSNKRRRTESTPTGAATADDAAQRERSMAGRRSLKRPLPSTLPPPPPSSSSSASSAPASGTRASSGPAASSAFAPLPSPFSQPLFAGPGGSSAMPIHPLYLSALQSAAPLTPQMLASLTGLPLIYPLPGSSPTPFIQPKPSSASATASSTGAPSALSSSSSSVPVSTATAQHSKATGKYTPIQPASGGGGYPPILPLPPILPFPSNAGSNGPMMPQHLSSSAPSVATLKRKAEKEAEEEKRRPLSRTAPVRGGGKGTASGSAVQSTVPLPGIGSFPSSSSSSPPTSASMATGSDASAANSTAAAASVLAFTSALASVTSLSPPSPSSFDAPFCSSFTETSSDSNPFSGATQGPFSPFSPLFASPTSYSSTVIPSTGAGSSGGTPSSLFSLSASSAPSAIDVDLIGSESGNHGSRYYYGAPFPEIEAFDVAGEKKLDYLNVDVIVVPKEESSTNNGGKAAGDPSSPTRSGRGGRGSGRGRGRSGGLGRSTEGDNARGTLTASRGSSSTTTTTTAERGTRSGSARSKGGSRAMTATHPVYDASQGASPGSTLPPYVPPKIRPTPVKPAAASPPRRARPAAADTSVGAPKVSTSKRTSATTPTPTLEEAKRSEDEYITAELLMSLGFGKDQRSTSSTPTTARVEEKNSETSDEREEDEDRNNSDGPLLETNATPAAVAKENGNAVAPEEVEDDEPELCIAEEDDDDDDEEKKNDEAGGARSLNDKKRKREQDPATGAGELRGLANGKSPRTDHGHQPHHHQPAPLMRAQAL